MGVIHRNLVLRNASRHDEPPQNVKMLADSGADLSVIPEVLALSMGFDVDDAHRRPSTLADGRVVGAPYVGPIEFRWRDRRSFGGAIVLGDQPLLGAVQMEDMDLQLDLRRRRVVIPQGGEGGPRNLAVGVRPPRLGAHGDATP